MLLDIYITEERQQVFKENYEKASRVTTHVFNTLHDEIEKTLNSFSFGQFHKKAMYRRLLDELGNITSVKDIAFLTHNKINLMSYNADIVKTCGKFYYILYTNDNFFSDLLDLIEQNNYEPISALFTYDEMQAFNVITDMQKHGDSKLVLSLDEFFPNITETK